MTDNYETPEWLKLPLFDPCPLNSTIDGLTIEWQKWNFVNPPYSDPLSWVKKAIEESKKGKHSVLLLRVDTPQQNGISYWSRTMPISSIVMKELDSTANRPRSAV